MIKPIFSLIILVFSVGFGFFYAKPEYDQVQNTLADSQQLDKTSQSASEIKDIIAETGKSLSAVDPDDLARFDVFLPETLDSVRFANNLQHIGMVNGLVLSDINVEQQEKKKNTTATTSKVPSSALSGVGSVAAVAGGTVAEKKYTATKASFTFVTTYSGFLLFLNDMEKSLGLINITSLSFKELPVNVGEKTVQKNLPSLYQFSIGIETYSLK